MALPASVFAEIGDQLFKHRYIVKIHVGTLVGGTPTSDKVAEGWIRTKMGGTTDEEIRAEVEKVMEQRGVTPDIAVEEVARNRHLTGFKRDFGTPLARADQQKAMTTGFVLAGQRKVFSEEEARRLFGELFLEGRQIKAMLKEALMIGVASEHIDGTKWGKTSKSAKGFFAEHAFVEEEQVFLGLTEASTVDQSFVHTFRGAGIKLEEKVFDAEPEFTIIADYDFETKVKDFWGIVLSIGERNGLGASRSQGYGRFAVTSFQKVPSDPKTTAKATKRAKEILAEDARRREAELAAVGASS